MDFEGKIVSDCILFSDVYIKTKYTFPSYLSDGILSNLDSSIFDSIGFLSSVIIVGSVSLITFSSRSFSSSNPQSINAA